jgi:hypothetical protein
VLFVFRFVCFFVSAMNICIYMVHTGLKPSKFLRIKPVSLRLGNPGLARRCLLGVSGRAVAVIKVGVYGMCIEEDGH